MATYNTHVITCLNCMNLVMCGRNIKGQVHVKCVQDVLEQGRLTPLIDVLDRKVESDGCAVQELMGSLKGIGGWQRYVDQIRRNFIKENNNN